MEETKSNYYDEGVSKENSFRRLVNEQIETQRLIDNLASRLWVVAETHLPEQDVAANNVSNENEHIDNRVSVQVAINSSLKELTKKLLV